MSIIKMLIDSGKPTSKFLTYPPKYLQQQNSTHFLRTKVRSQFQLWTGQGPTHRVARSWREQLVDVRLPRSHWSGTQRPS